MKEIFVFENQESASMDPTSMKQPAELSDQQLADVVGGLTVSGGNMKPWDRDTRIEKCTVCGKETTFNVVRVRYADADQTQGYAWWACSECGTVWRLHSGNWWHRLWHNLFTEDWSKEYWSSADLASQQDSLWR